MAFSFSLSAEIFGNVWLGIVAIAEYKRNDINNFMAVRVNNLTRV